MNHPLMPKATAVWLVENTALSFEQIADFCGLHTLEVNAIADDEVVIGMQGMNPISAGDLTMEEIERCQADTQARLKPAPNRSPITKKRLRDTLQFQNDKTDQMQLLGYLKIILK